MKIKIEFEANTCFDCVFLECDDYDYKCNYIHEYIGCDAEYEIYEGCPFKEKI